MAKTKAKKQQKQPKGATLPAGFRAVAVGGSFGVTHDFHKEKILQGKVLGMDTVKVTDEETGKKIPRRVMRVLRADGVTVSVWESHQLKEVFNEAKKGKGVYMQYLGQKALGKGRKVNLFSAGVQG